MKQYESLSQTSRKKNFEEEELAEQIYLITEFETQFDSWHWFSLLKYKLDWNSWSLTIDSETNKTACI